jgi:hypothetical protein
MERENLFRVEASRLDREARSLETEKVLSLRIAERAQDKVDTIWGTMARAQSDRDTELRKVKAIDQRKKKLQKQAARMRKKANKYE